MTSDARNREGASAARRPPNRDPPRWTSGSSLRFVLTAGLLLAAAGVYGTDRLGWPAAWLYWSVLLGIGVWLGSALNNQLVGCPPLGTRWTTRWLLVSAGLSIPMFGTVVVSLILIGQPVPVALFGDLLLKVAIVTVAVTGARLLGARPEAPRTATAAPTSTPPPEEANLEPRLYARLPSKLKGGEIWALSAEDHYLRVHTSKGEDLILLRFSDGITEVAPVEGLRIHRSWWVAKAGVQAAFRKGEGGIVRLKSGVDAPVSRQRAPEVARQGWFQR